MVNPLALAPAPVPLFGAVPGGVEILIVLLVLLLLFGPVVVIVVLAMRRLGDDTEVRDLERRIDELETKVGERPNEHDGRPSERNRREGAPTENRRDDDDADSF